MKISQKTKYLVAPDARRGSSPEVTSIGSPSSNKPGNKSANEHINRILKLGLNDENFLFIQKKVSNFKNMTDAALVCLHRALHNEDIDGFTAVAHQLMIEIGKIGAIGMMRFCIAMQMLGSRGMLENAKGVIHDLEKEYSRVIEGFIPVAA